MKEIKVCSITAKICKCGRLYEDSKDENGNMMCSACYTGLSIESLKLLWGTPMPNSCKKLFLN